MRKTDRIQVAFFLFLGIFSAAAAGADEPKSVARSIETAFVDVAKKVGPSVVSISAEATEKVAFRRQMQSPSSQFDQDLFNRFFRDFLGDLPDQEFKQKGLGTGVIISSDGYILTNEHVIHHADKVTVTLPDGREFKGQMKGADVRTDLAIIQIDATNLPFVQLGDSDQVKIGQWAIAVGNPFGWAVGGSEPTVTVGVISALRRSIRLGPGDRDYSNLIQTDAAINPGNSGGPLVNLDGDVIGINVAIFSTTGGYQGIGFAVPSNAARAILSDLIQGKKILYGWLGVNVQDLSEELAKYFGAENREGTVIAQVMPNSPAQKAGLKDGDIIKSLDGKPIKDVRDLSSQVSKMSVGKKIPVGIIRDRRAETVTLRIGERPSSDESKSSASEEEDTQEKEEWRGIRVTAVTSELAKRYQLEKEQGVLVTHVESGSPSEESGVRPGDVILEINRRGIDSMADFKNAAAAVHGDALIKTGRGFFVIKPER